ncbi:hypothetical protein E2562_024206 [Oryza meyeriana var. granulata]|uniref:Uncharacterized protein n=1 Tax=Oryza meyeriana var. granulata TaxID=110450 RepID=A0A6G1C0I0_9ORYZ|nr:hypothetical protein E2562_024206 [Oryza meyeriana var. granulata]
MPPHPRTTPCLPPPAFHTTDVTPVLGRLCATDIGLPPLVETAATPVETEDNRLTGSTSIAKIAASAGEVSVKAITFTVPMEDLFFTAMKAITLSVNYMPNALAIVKAEEHNTYTLVWVVEARDVAE